MTSGNPLGTVFAGAEMLMQLDPAPTQVKRLAVNIYRAAGRMRELLADLAGASCGNKSTSEICKIRDVITAASEAVLPAAETQGVQILHDVPDGLEIPLERSRIERVFFNLITNALEAMPHGGKIRIGARKGDDLRTDRSRRPARVSVAKSSGWRHRQRDGGPRLDHPARSVLASRARSGARRKAGAVHIGLESLAGWHPTEALQPRIRAAQLARFPRLRLRRDRRHGLPHTGL